MHFPWHIIKILEVTDSPFYSDKVIDCDFWEE